MDLYLVRHAVAFDFDPSRWPDDSQRPLTPEGQKRFKRSARGLRALVPSVDVVLSSPWVRAWQTAEILESEAHWPSPLACEALASGRAPAEILQALEPSTSHGMSALGGHEPSLHELVSYLLAADMARVQIEMKKGGLARLKLSDGLRPGAARLQWLLAPKVLRALTD
ncbi:MAG: SixA phosphatase family protein [Chloroflexota bacterium]